MGEGRSIGRIGTAVIAGVRAQIVTVEVHRGSGLPRQTIVGLPSGAVRESLDRIHAACSNEGVSMAPRKTTINLAPAGVRKSGAGLDLPIALALLAADGAFEPDSLQGLVCLGELGLDGQVRGVNGVLPTALAARRSGMRRLLVPLENGAEAAAVPDLEVRTVTSLRAAIRHVAGEARAPRVTGIDDEAPGPVPSSTELADVRGLSVGRRALEIAAAGGHHLLMSGPPGSGKTLLARALPGLLPSLSFEQALEVSAVHSVVGALRGHGLLRTPPFRAPHHTVTPAGLVGGGQPLRPGEISLATHGVLFLDELPEFRRQALECLRQPLEEGRVHVTRANESHEFPASFQLVAAMNECPCGRGPADAGCQCGLPEIARYRRRASGPLLDRIDLFVRVERTSVHELGRTADGESSATVAGRVAAARAIQARRGRRLDLAQLENARLPPRRLLEDGEFDAGALRTARRLGERLRLSARAWHRTLRVARTCADLDGSEGVTEAHVREALHFREPATGESLGRRTG